MAATEIKMQLQYKDRYGNCIVSFNVTNIGREICQYSELLKYRHITVDYLVDHFAVFDAIATDMKSIGEYKGFLDNLLKNGDDKFLEVFVVGEAKKLVEKLMEISNTPEIYLNELMFYKDLKRIELFSGLPISDPEIEEWMQNPKEMALAIMGEKIFDALAFIPNMRVWGDQFPVMYQYADKLVEIARKIADMLTSELSKLPPDAGCESHPQFFCWWHLDNALGILEERLNESLTLL